MGSTQRAEMKSPISAGEFPHCALAAENWRRGKDQPEFELLETGR